jgi:hypothetical protein
MANKLLLAPNGKPSNLNATQYKLVRTSAFKKWFGDWENDPSNASKVVDENGEPLVVYHGTGSYWTVYNFEKHGRTDGGYFGKAIYASQSFDIASSYASKKNIDETPQIMSLFCVIKNPYFVINGVFQEGISNKNKSIYETYSGYNFNKIGEKLKKDVIKKGFDGVFIVSNNEKSQVICFNPNQIKLADGSNTEFNPNSNDIRFEQGGVTENTTPDYLRMFLGK